MFSTATKTEIFESHRPLLFSIAYRMLGSAMEAEDMVQECYLRYQAHTETVQYPKAFLSTIITRLCLDQLKSAKVQREDYIGPWLPEPIMTHNETSELVSMAFLVLLESLSPIERAIFLLREAFDYDYQEIAEMVGKSEANCRQYYHRAKQYLAARRPRFTAPLSQQKKLTHEFLQAMQTGNIHNLTHLLAEEVTLWSDGGGKVHAAKRPLVGREMVLKLLLGTYRKRPEGLRVDPIELNGTMSLLIWQDDHLMAVMNFAMNEQHIGEIRMVWNPDKLQYLQRNLPEL